MTRPPAVLARSLSLLCLGALLGAPLRADDVEARAEVPRAEASASADALRPVVHSQLQLAADLLRLAEGAGNRVCSPWSILQALGMTSAGARGETLEEMTRALHLLPQDRLHPALGSLDLILASRGKAPLPKWRQDGRPFALASANQLWGQAGKAFQPEFLALLARHYGAGLRRIDFRADPAAAREAINAWVAERTRDKIQGLLQPPVPGPDARLVLVNAVYFLADWDQPFDPEATRPAAFTRRDGSQVQAPTMHQTEHRRLAEAQGTRAVVLPYLGGEIDCWVLLPPEGQLDRVAADLPAVVGALEAKLANAYVDLALPKFELSWRLDLSQALQAMGMQRAFRGGEADFSGMDGTRELYVGAVIHQAWVALDEKGTEAAAATAVAMNEMGLPPEPVPFVVDRPFLFLVRDRATGAVLFCGQVEDPTAR